MEELFVGQHICINALGGLGKITEITRANVVLVESLLTWEIVSMTNDDAQALKVDLKRTAIRNAIGLIPILPTWFTLSVEIKDPTGKMIFWEKYISWEDDRISDS